MLHTSSTTCMHTTAPLLARQTPPDHSFAQAAGFSRRSLHRYRRAQAACCRATIGESVRQKATPICVSSTAIWVLSQLPAQAEGTDFSQGSFSKESYYVTLGLFVLSVPGLWSQIKRAPKAKRVRKTFETKGPKEEGSLPLDQRARQIFAYFKKYNYDVKDTGDVIRFTGNYKASRGQAAALTFYVFMGLGSTALVLSIAAPFGGSYWYALTALSPLAGIYYWQKGSRIEEFAVKMVTADDDSTTDIVVEGDQEEVTRMSKELQLVEKGKVYVKGLLE
ncbi:hypothetical protein ABBQ38_010570 [Trebouxia sp. C0009 RCD-2024]